MLEIFTLLGYAILFYVVFHALRMAIILIINKYLSIRNVQMSSVHTHAQSNRRILIAGDSTAVGTGASHPDDTIAGMLAREYPHTDIINIAENGARTRDVLGQLRRINTESFDVAIISTGGNDIWHFSNMDKLGRDLTKLLRSAKEISSHRVLLLLYANMGFAPLFPFPFNLLLERRSYKIQKLFRNVSYNEKVPCIELFTEDKDNPFIQNSNKYYASDKIHPNSEGYRLWYKRMWRIMSTEGYHFSE